MDLSIRIEQLNDIARVTSANISLRNRFIDASRFISYGQQQKANEMQSFIQARNKHSAVIVTAFDGKGSLNSHIVGTDAVLWFWTMKTCHLMFDRLPNDAPQKLWFAPFSTEFRAHVILF